MGKIDPLRGGKNAKVKYEMRDDREQTQQGAWL